MKLLEYFAAGLPCVSTTKGAEGISFTPGREIALADDPESFAAEVLRLLADDQAREDMGRAARDFAAWYDWGAIAQGYLDLFQGQGRGANYNHTVTRAIDQGQSPAPPLQRLVAEKDPLFSHLPPRVPSKPLTMLLLVNRGCNLRCSFCDLWDKPEELAFDKAVALLDEAVAIGTRTLVITGGEPFLYKRLFDLVGEAKARGMGVNITTNGTLIEKRWEALVSSGVDSVSVSIDGTSSTHDHLRGQEGCHKRTLKGLTRLKEDGRVGLSIYFVVTRENVRELPEVFALSQSLDIGFDFWPVNDERSHYLESEEDREAYRQSVATIASARPEVAARRAFYEEGLVYHNGGLGPVRCLGLVDQYGVTYTGDLLPCCVWGGEDLVVGNVFETPLSELWRSPEVQSHRHSLYGEGCSAGCFNHSLYEFTQSTGESFRVPQGGATS
jgi:MoaA/NifB/PqqE/SkfB family radical SAM enzyme